MPLDVEERIIATANAVGTSRSDVVLDLILKALHDCPNGYTLTVKHDEEVLASGTNERQELAAT
jgi:hypothetical protein